MTAHIINGSFISQHVKEKVAQRTHALLDRGVQPGLAVVLVGDHPSSQIYVRNKITACEKVGIRSIQEFYPVFVSQEKLLDRICALNQDPNVHGILVQLPLPEHINTCRIIEAICPEKDVDGFHISNAGLLMTGSPFLLPCTPYGIMKVLEFESINLVGAEAVVVGSSNIVGKPIALLLSMAGATVTICNSRTRCLSVHTKHADILVVAVGKPGVIDGSMIKPGSVVIDVGINRKPNSRTVCGDVDFFSAREVAGMITPVPFGIGPMTIAMLLVNTIKATQRQLSINDLPDITV